MGECGDNWRFKIEEEHKRKNQVVRDNHKIKIGGMGMKDIQKNNKVDGEVKGVGMKDIQKKKSSGRRGKKECEWTTSKYIIKYKEGKKKEKKKRSGSEQHPNT